MRILAIETSCDDTAIAILEIINKKVPGFKVLSNIVSSQQIHANYGGVFPMMAKREHQKNLVPVLKKALQGSGLLKLKSPTSIQAYINAGQLEIIEKIFKKEQELYPLVKKFLENYERPKIDAIAVTHGPGLEPCLWVGVNFAKALSYIWDIPLIPVNHIEAHILVNFMKHETWNMKQIFPAVSLVVSGGHTQLILVQGIGKYKIIGETLDDAAGECFDKAARILNLGYPGGPIISKIAATYRGPTPVKLPRPMMHSKDYNFSFSGLKTAVLYAVRDEKKNPSSPNSSGSQHFVSEMCFAVQDAICDVLIKKTINAARAYKAKTIILGGGVSANQELREQFSEKTKQENLEIIFPDAKLSTDNGLMIAVAGYFNRAKKIAWQKLSVNANLRLGEMRLKKRGN